MRRKKNNDSEAPTARKAKKDEFIATRTKYSQLQEALHRSEEQLRQSQKMEAIGLLAGGVAHDFSNLLTAISGYSDLMLNKMPVNDPLRRNVEGIKEAGDRATSLTRQLLAFSRKQVLNPQVHNLNSIITGIERMLRRIIKESVDVQTVLDPTLAGFKADSGQIEQIIMNLAINARDAMPEGGALILETANVKIDVATARRLGDIKPGDYVMLAVTDSGIGMSKDIQSRIFEPFFTTKEIGTGLGLSTVYGIVKQSGGAMWVYSEPNQGATFKIYFPQVEPDSLPLIEATVDDEIRSKSRTVLLTEDDDIVRELVAHIVEDAGFKLYKACNGPEALDIFRKHKKQVDFLITDIIMPFMNGFELANSILTDKPEVKVLFMSGYSGDSGEGMEKYVSNFQQLTFIEKPFTPERLIRKIKETFNTESKPALLLAEHKKLIVQSSKVETQSNKVQTEISNYEKSALLMSVRVLVIDDEIKILDVFKSFLEGLGCEVAQASSGIHAIEIARGFDPEIIISDYKMPGMDGVQTLRTLHDICPTAISILITGHPDTTIIATLFREFVFDFLRKPISLVELRQVLERAIEHRTATERERWHGDFLSIVSHELREPLQGPLSIIDNFLTGLYGPVDEQQRDRLLRVSQGLRTEKRLVNNLLDLSYIEAGRFAIEKTETSFRDVLNEVVESLEMKASDRNVGIIWNLPKNRFWILVDVDQVKQALSNVLVNAINHTPSGKSVVVKIHGRGGNVVCFIQDEGEGVPSQYFESIFERGFQIPSKTKVNPIV